ncbi:helix-turn-helix transcriptional regulator [Pseudomonas gingeri]|uniref:AraC family transcriptional regulator n=1 Tax=Pseudomonas gingeri TaxID=117681 RepID=UPI0015A19A88|nr:helix-turn-helix transcriptional regulator [Pseudomonas gingeri]NVZ61920.1 helix-turn-helix transcriptional regulator [Pseudomonas gingeri]NVZ79503.1 helix-turn-helix transcriptional regulator [Pseudomonas gingeri]
MRNTALALYDHLPQTVIAIGTDYPHGHLLARHQHRRAQLLYGATGVMHVLTDDGNWIVPPQRAVWIPLGVPHQVLMLGVSTRSLYIEPTAAGAMNPTCQVLEVSALLRQLLIAAVEMPVAYDEQGRDGALITLVLHELASASSLPLHIPLPRDPRLLPLCQAFVEHPDIRQSPQAWADRLHLSLRSFGRLFQEQVALSFSHWRQRVCVVQALARLSAGEAVTRIALDFGYQSPAAFSTMFRRVLGRSPSSFLHTSATL